MTYLGTCVTIKDETEAGALSRGQIAAGDRTWSLIVLVVLLPLLSGCGYIPWPESFGEVAGANSTRSINGLGVYRRMWESAGARVLTPKKLSPRLSNIDTLILVGSTYQPPGSLARDWLENWLGEKAGRTVVYFGRDFDAGLLYRAETLVQVAEADRSRARDQLASSRASQYMLRNSQIPEDTFCRWFFLRISARSAEHTRFTGPWSTELAGIEGQWPVGVLLEPPDKEQINKMPSWITGTKPALAPVTPLFSGSDANEALGDKEIQRSIWRTDELDDAEAWEAEWDLAGEAEVLLAGQAGTPLIYRLNHTDFPGSKILIVVNGAPFLNGSLIKPLHRKVSELVIDECLPSKRVAMIEYDQQGLLISNIESGSESNVGMELLTLWPLSAITMHAAFWGLIGLAVLLPILGRPQKLAPRSVTDFGLHVEAMGRMLFESRDMRYALRAIGDYFRKVRRESPPDWLTQMSVLEAAAEAEKQAALEAKTARKSPKMAATAPPSRPLTSTGQAEPSPKQASAPDQAQPTDTSTSDPVS